jgi:hypothetical protein
MEARSSVNPVALPADKKLSKEKLVIEAWKAVKEEKAAENLRLKYPERDDMERNNAHVVSTGSRKPLLWT